MSVKSTVFEIFDFKNAVTLKTRLGSVEIFNVEKCREMLGSIFNFVTFYLFLFIIIYYLFYFLLFYLERKTTEPSRSLSAIAEFLVTRATRSIARYMLRRRGWMAVSMSQPVLCLND